MTIEEMDRIKAEVLGLAPGIVDRVQSAESRADSEVAVRGALLPLVACLLKLEWRVRTAEQMANVTHREARRMLCDLGVSP